MGNVLGVNTVTDTVFVRNNGSILDKLYSITLVQGCNKGALLSNNTGWIVSTVVNGTKLDVTFTYDNNNTSLDLTSLSGSLSIGMVEGVGAFANQDPSNIVLQWTRYKDGPVNIASGVELVTSLVYTFANYIFNNNIVFTSTDYIVNYDKFCPQEYSPVTTVISSSVQESGHNVVVIGSVTVGPGLWYIVCNGGFNLTNKKYFFLTDKLSSEVSDFNNYIATNDEILSSFGTHKISNSDNIYPVNTSMVYDNNASSSIVRWCFTCEDSGAILNIFDEMVVSSNDYVHGRPNNLSICAIKISS